MDNQRLKRHIALFCDRILRGGSLSGQSKQEANEEMMKGATRSLDKDEKSVPKKSEVMYYVNSKVFLREESK